jgi:hypothetical protein
MLTENTLETLRYLKLHGMVQALEHQRETPDPHALAFEERLGLLVDRERLYRQNGRYRGLLREARLTVAQACIEDISYKPGRGLDKSQIAALADGAWIQRLTQLSHPLPMEYKLLAFFRVAVAYPLFLYANFSGYIDIALARLMRIRLPENFDRPFSASFGVFCFFVTFFLIGVWHGRNSEFLVFGVLQGGGVAINKLWQLGLTRVLTRKGYKALAKNRAYIAFGRGLAYSCFAFSLFWFWANWKQIDAAFTSLGLILWLGVWLAIWLCATVVLAFWEWMRVALLSIKTTDGPVLTTCYARVVFSTALGLVAFIVTVLLSLSAPDLVYKAF